MIKSVAKTVKDLKAIARYYELHPEHAWIADAAIAAGYHIARLRRLAGKNRGRVVCPCPEDRRKSCHLPFSMCLDCRYSICCDRYRKHKNEKEKEKKQCR